VRVQIEEEYEKALPRAK
jgi:hypothetical protein